MIFCAISQDTVIVKYCLVPENINSIPCAVEGGGGGGGVIGNSDEGKGTGGNLKDQLKIFKGIKV